MHIAKQTLISALFGLLLLGAPALAEDNLDLVGLWKIVSFHTEDVQILTRNNVYGEHPVGFMQVAPDGRFSAFVFSSRPEPALSIWEDAARAFGEQTPTYSGIIYSGKYRVDGNKLIVHVDRVQHDGPVGPGTFDMSWTEGRTATEEVRHFRLEDGPLHSKFLHVETPPIANPNGVGNMIIGRLIWERISNWEGH